MTQLIAILEDDERRTLAMRLILKQKQPECLQAFFDNAPEMIAWLKNNLSSVTLISLDHDLGPNRDKKGEVFDPGIGREVVDFLVSQRPICPVIIHTTNPQGGEGMKWALEEGGWQHETVIPFQDIEWIEGLWIRKVLELGKGEGEGV
ncbi:MAG TPA: hypothetical protein EYP59_00155 [Thiotrichaceae bacterium]|nr:hypothetical protein [Thiotrichaceae bacterium]